MNTIIIILLVLAGIIAVLLIIALFMKKEHYVKREIIINAPRQKVFDFLKLLKNQEQFNKWATADKKNRKEKFHGTDGTVGFIYSWSGDKSAGQGAKEIKNIVEGKRIETEIRFVKPMRVTASVIFETESLFDDQTKVNLINTGTLKYPLNIMIPMAEKNFPKDMDESLSTLKKILEK
ncbi:MAG: SRPBCC family protein [Bacteroidia bacterium]